MQGLELSSLLLTDKIWDNTTNKIYSEGKVDRTDSRKHQLFLSGVRFSGDEHTAGQGEAEEGEEK